MINVLADKYLYNIESYLPESINLQLFDPSSGLPPAIQDAHGLLIRTVIPINKQTLPNIPPNLSFVGTGSAGSDHVDIDYLKNNNITFTDAAGCNARSVAEYVATALLLWSEERNMPLLNLSVGIVGAGHVGTQVINQLQKLGIQTVAYDPPRQKKEADFTSASLEQILACDILSFHTPLTTDGPYPTYHWLNTDKLKGQAFDLIINTARGGVVDEQAVLQAIADNRVGDIIIDVWEDEPIFRIKTAKKAFIKTPHIAGYSIKAKENASKFIAEDLINHFNLEKPKISKKTDTVMFNEDISSFDSQSELLTELHPIKGYEDKLLKIMHDHVSERGERFNKLRAEFPLRPQFEQIHLPYDYFNRFPVLRNLGFVQIRK